MICNDSSGQDLPLEYAIAEETNSISAAVTDRQDLIEKALEQPCVAKNHLRQLKNDEIKKLSHIKKSITNHIEEDTAVGFAEKPAKTRRSKKAK